MLRGDALTEIRHREPGGPPTEKEGTNPLYSTGMSLAALRIQGCLRCTTEVGFIGVPCRLQVLRALEATAQTRVYALRQKRGGAGAAGAVKLIRVDLAPAGLLMQTLRGCAFAAPAVCHRVPYSEISERNREARAENHVAVTTPNPTARNWVRPT